MTPRDLVTHRSGLPRHDLVWYNNLGASREELVRRLAYLEPTADLRAKWQYNNLMFLTAGYLAERSPARPGRTRCATRIFTPLGMSRSNFSVADSQKSDDFALPYRLEGREARAACPSAIIDDRARPAPSTPASRTWPSG